ncbi:DUF805 domain-containing protein [Flavisolibacter ginsenosidimutans]|uniref:DUF805 domain-containing protein n=1 Tax=Flavisolibacter ginsenosidimutans TaxID=661481 RepID=A0A5B8UHG3_9BACT|nr:DUF805 domain-containing protein [Flavisolibacter ginsenosidimutans]QEC55776.1 DUF805 domain-containing protein [Flavisolibacter ginsenosidimutans]
MFKSPFSFNGRIRRKEYVLSFVIYLFIAMFFSVAVNELVPQRSENLRGVLAFFIVIPVLWFMLAQGAKRSHDLGNSGWFMFIPFYGFWLLFAESKPGINEYGPNPKGIGNETAFSFEQEQSNF